jgi:small subunit ribosomal protein S4
MRYTGPKHRLARREGKNFTGKASASLARRVGIPPGAHGVKGKRKISDFGVQLREKQLAKRVYGLSEKQFVKYYKNAKKVKGKTGEALLQALECRLDTVTYRLGFAPSLAMARQLVSHGHVKVNQGVVNIPSYSVKLGQVISLGDKAAKIPAVARLLESGQGPKLDWLERQANAGRFLSIPSREQIPVEVNEQLIVEYYSR